MFIVNVLLRSENPFDDRNLEISGYNLIRSDHPSNTNRVGLCIYYKLSLPVRVLNISLLQECINFELEIHELEIVQFHKL